MSVFRCALALLAPWLIAALAWADDESSQVRNPEVVRQLLVDAKFGLPQAVEMNQRIWVPGGTLLAVRLEKQEGGPRFGAYFLRGDGITLVELEIDPVSGVVVYARGGIAGMENVRVGGQPLADAKKAAGMAKITLAQAIRTSGDKVKDAKPFEAEMRLQGDKAVAEVELLSGDRVMVVHVDGTDGKVTRVEERKPK